MHSETEEDSVPERRFEITVVAYDPAWPAAFADEARQLRDILGDNAVRIFHIGSTSVPGLMAKPVIDILPVVRDLVRLDQCVERMAALGYEAKGEYGIPGRRFFYKGGAHRTHHLHAFQYANTEHILRHVAFRDYLRSHPGVVADYAILKAQLAKRHPHDIEAYCDGKDGFVKQTEQAALQWHWRRGLEA